jgi:hypothetical protein
MAPSKSLSFIGLDVLPIAKNVIAKDLHAKMSKQRTYEREKPRAIARGFWFSVRPISSLAKRVG